MMSVVLVGAILFYYVRSWSQEERLWLRSISPFFVATGLSLYSYSSKIFAKFDYSEPSTMAKVIVSLPALGSFAVLVFSWCLLKPQLERLATFSYTLITSLFLASTLWVFVAIWR